MDNRWALTGVLISGFPKSILIKNGQIEAVLGPNESLPEDIYVKNCYGMSVSPARIDPHVHGRFPGGEQKEDPTSLSTASIYGGVGTAFLMPNTSPAITTVESVASLFQTIEDAPLAANMKNKRPDYYVWFGASNTNIDIIAEALALKQVIGVKVFLGSSTGDLLVTDENILRKIFTICAEHNSVVAVHCEDEDILKANRAKLGDNARVSDHHLIRSEDAEIESVKKALRLQKETGCRLYLCHLSTLEAIKLGYRAKQEGQPVYIEVCSHHLILPDNYYKNEKETWRYKMNPPLRSITNMLDLRQLLSFPDIIDCVGSDHAPHTVMEKKVTGYDNVPSGVPGVETAFSAIFYLVNRRDLGLNQFNSLIAENAAEIFGLKSKGRIEPGYDADLVIFNPNCLYEPTDTNMHSKCGWTPFQDPDRPLWGRISATVIGGTIIEL